MNYKHTPLILFFTLGAVAGAAVFVASDYYERSVVLQQQAPDRFATYKRLAEVEKIDSDVGLVQVRLLDSSISNLDQVIFKITPRTNIEKHEIVVNDGVIEAVRAYPVTDIAELSIGSQILVLLALSTENTFEATAITIGDPFPLP